MPLTLPRQGHPSSEARSVLAFAGVLPPCFRKQSAAHLLHWLELDEGARGVQSTGRLASLSRWAPVRGGCTLFSLLCSNGPSSVSFGLSCVPLWLADVLCEAWMADSIVQVRPVSESGVNSSMHHRAMNVALMISSLEAEGLSGCTWGEPPNMVKVDRQDSGACSLCSLFLAKVYGPPRSPPTSLASLSYRALVLFL